MSNAQMINKMERIDSFSKTTKRIVKFSHSWTIENFGFFLPEKFIESPLFGAEGDPETRWCLKLYPKGDTDEVKDHISLYLVLVSTQRSEVSVGAVVHLRGADGVSCEKAFVEAKKLTANGSWGWRKFILRDTKDKKYLSDDNLTIQCEVSYAMETENIANQDPQSQAQCDGTKVLNKIYQTRMLSDVVPSLDGKDFRANKVVLAARSPFLKCLSSWTTRKARRQ